MPVNYSVFMMKNPMNPESPKKAYAKAQASKILEFDMLCKRVAHGCTCTKADVSAVLIASVEEMQNALQDGEIVVLGELGRFQTQVSSHPAVTEEQFTNTQIKGARISFKPGKALRDALATMSYQKVPQLPVKEKKTAEE